jgi:hypothetical protein
MGITAGWDTRLLLASSREYKEKIFYYVNKPSSFNDSTKDIKIPKNLSRKLGFKLNIIDIPDEVSTEFKEYFSSNNILSHEKLLSVFYNVYKNKWDRTYTVSGAMANGVARIYMPFPKGYEITGKNIALLADYGDSKYVIRELDKWCDQVIPICEKTGIKIMYLYQWEQDNAHWAALTSSEQDIVREEIRPFNNRRLIELLWSLEDKYRYQHHPIIYIKIMQILWKEVLETPINPSRKSNLFRILRLLGIEQKTYYAHKKRKFLHAAKIS